MLEEDTAPPPIGAPPIREAASRVVINRVFDGVFDGTFDGVFDGLPVGLIHFLGMFLIAAAAYLGVRHPAFGGNQEKPRVGSTALVLLGGTLVLAIIFVMECEVNYLLQAATLLMVPVVSAVGGAIRFPEAVPMRDVGCVVAFFVFIAAANINRLVLMPLDVLESESVQLAPAQLAPEAHRIRQATAVLSTGAIVAHALTVALRRCEGFWSVTRASMAFAGVMRLASTGTLCALGVQGNAYPPGNLDIFSSLLVCSGYVGIAAVLTRSRRHDLSWRFAHVRRYLRAWLPMPQLTGVTAPGAGGPDRAGHGQMGGLCVVCMDAPNDHAFIACGHLCTCAECAECILQSSAHCPVCRSTVTGSLKTYLP